MNPNYDSKYEQYKEEICQRVEDICTFWAKPCSLSVLARGFGRRLQSAGLTFNDVIMQLRAEGRIHIICLMSGKRFAMPPALWNALSAVDKEALVEGLNEVHGNRLTNQGHASGNKKLQKANPNEALANPMRTYSSHPELEPIDLSVPEALPTD